MKTKTRPRPSIRDFVADDATVIATEGFIPHFRFGGRVEKGTYYKLDSPLVRAFPMYFGLCIPIDQVLGEIER
jgi:hypothetical protein